MKKLILIVPIIIIISVVVAFALLLLEFWIEGIVVLAFSIVLNWWSETFALNCFRQKCGHYDFRVLTYNINRAHEISVNKGTTENLIEFILEQNADIVFLQEYNAELYPLVQERLTQEYPYGSGIGIASRFKSVFCRFPIESCEQLMVDSDNPVYEDVLKNVRERDYIDSHRAVSPLRKADDAIVLDNSNLTFDEQDKWLMDQYLKAAAE